MTKEERLCKFISRHLDWIVPQKIDVPKEIKKENKEKVLETIKKRKEELNELETLLAEFK